MIPAFLIKILTPFIVEVIREMLERMARGEAVAVNETTVSMALHARGKQIGQAIQDNKK
jgi:hypothetical protein